MVFLWDSTHRNDLSYYAEGKRDHFPVALIGETHLSEEKVTDPGQTYGFFRTVFNQAVEDEIRALLPDELKDQYHYVPKQRLPRWLNWVSLSYTAQF